MFGFRKTNHQPLTAASDTTNSMDDTPYFEDAKSWSYERYQIQEVMANRWQLAFWSLLALSGLLVVVLILLFPLKRWEPIVIQRNEQTGEVWVDTVRNHDLPETSSEIESDLVRYVIARETFSLTDHNVRKTQVFYTSSSDVVNAYEALQASHNPKSPINLYGSKGLRTVKVHDVIFLDNASNAIERRKQQQEKIPTLAKVDFSTTETSGQTLVQKSWVATIRFSYLGTPDEKEAAWLNWNGFTVTSYRVDQRNV